MDFSWFLTIPGMLITGGVLLLVIALIIFIATSNKKDKTKSDASKKSEEGAKEMVNQMEQNTAVPSNNMINNNVVEPMPINNVVTVPEQTASVSLSSNSGVNGVSTQSVGIEQTTPEVTAPNPSFDVGFAGMSQSNEVGVTASVMPEAAPVSDMNGVVSGPVAPDLVAGVPTMPEVMTTPVDNVATSIVNDSTASVPTAPMTPEVAPTVDFVPTMPEVSMEAPVTNMSETITNQMEDNNVNLNTFGDSNATIPIVPEINAAPVVTEEPIVTNVAAPIQPANVVESPSIVTPVVDVNTQAPVSIYGGVSPSVQNIDVEQSHQIYGGANPLDNTQNISIVDINQAAADAMAHNAINNTSTPDVVSVPSVEPTPSPEVVPVTAVQPVTPVTPNVVAAPTVVPTSNQIQ